MPITVGGTTITFNDGSTQSTAAGAPTTTQVLNATAGASAGAVGTYAFLGRTTPNTFDAFGATVSGSLLVDKSGIPISNEQCGVWYYSPLNRNPIGTTKAGTWRCMGRPGTTSNGTSAATLWLRIS